MEPPKVKPLPERGSENAPERPWDGVDLSLIRWMLSLTPAERLNVLQQHMEAVEALRERA